MMLNIAIKACIIVVGPLGFGSGPSGDVSPHFLVSSRLPLFFNINWVFGG